MMSNISSVSQTEVAKTAKLYLESFPGNLICARQIWYEGLEGCGVPSAETLETLTSVLSSLPEWKDVGNVRYEKFGQQPSFKKVK